MPARRIRVIVVDDVPLMRRLIARFLTGVEDIEVVAHAGDGREAINVVEAYPADVILLDVVLPTISGDIATRELIRRFPNLKVLALSAYGDLQLVARMLQAGAMGYALKDASPEELVEAIRMVARGTRYFSPTLASRMLAELGAKRSLPPSYLGPAARALSVLSPRERHVVQLVAEGNRSAEIARMLGVTEKTVSLYRERIAEKLDLHGIASLTKYAVRSGLTPLGEC